MKRDLSLRRSYCVAASLMKRLLRRVLQWRVDPPGGAVASGPSTDDWKHQVCMNIWPPSPVASEICNKLLHISDALVIPKKHKHLVLLLCK